MNTRLAKDNILGRLKQAKRTPKTAEEMAFFLGVVTQILRQMIKPNASLT